MKNFSSYILTLFVLLSLTSCWEDRSWQYYEKVQTKTWMYETMQKNYLFYEDLPVLDEKDKIFFKSPNDFLHSVASKKDGKAGYTFSHVDSISSTSRTISEYPGFGYEAAFVNVRFASQLVPALRVLYVQKNSPADKNGIKRGDWIVAVDSLGVKSENMSEYTDRPTQAHEFMFAEINATNTGFDTLETTKVLTPELVDVKNILYDRVLETEGGHKAYYIMYNEFGDDKTEWNTLFRRMAAAQFDDVVVDLRYNPGGYLGMLQYMATNLAPASQMGETFVELLPNKDLDLKPTVFTFDEEMLVNGAPVSYRNLYVIATLHSASASEAFINCLRPYVEHMYHVGTNTFGKNMAQTRFLDEKLASGLEFWLTTHYVANKEHSYDYYEKGLLPDFLKPENMGGDLGELGTPADSLLQPILYHMDNGTFAPSTPQQPESGVQMKTVKFNVLSNTIDRKKKEFLIK